MDEKEIKINDADNVVVREPLSVLLDPPMNKLVAGFEPTVAKILIGNSAERHPARLQHVDDTERPTPGFERTQVLFTGLTGPAFSFQVSNILEENGHLSGQHSNQQRVRN